MSLKKFDLKSYFFAFFALLIHTSLTHAETAEYVDYSKILLEERAWAGLESKTLRVGDVTWAYSEGGAVDRPTLLLIHGIGSGDSWNYVAKNLVPYYHVVILDLPGTGSTLVPKDFDLSLQNIAEHIRRFTEAARIQNKLNIAGHSVGGSVAMLYAAKYPLDTTSLFLISTGGLFKSSQTQYLNNPAYLKQLLVSKPGDLNYVARQIMYKPPFIPNVIRVQREKYYISKSNETAQIIDQLVAMNKAYTVESFAQIFKNIEAPTLILWGKQDQIVNVEISKEIKTLIRKSEPVIVLDNVGHIPILEAPELVAQHYLQFLNQLNSK